MNASPRPDARVLLAAVVLPLAGFALVQGLWMLFPLDALLAGLRPQLRGAGAPALFVLLYALGVAGLLPVSVLAMTAGAAFGWHWGALWVWLGSVAGAALAFGLGRGLFRGWVARRFAGDPTVGELDHAATAHGGALVFLLRLCPFPPFGAGNYLCSLSPVRWRPYLLGTALGAVPGCLVYPGLGHLGLGSLGDLFRADPLLAAGLLSAGAVGLSLVAGAVWTVSFLLRRRLRAAAQKRTEGGHSAS